MVRELIFVIATINAIGFCESEHAGIRRKGDGGVATKAEINGPSAIALDRQGNLYVFEAVGGAVRRVEAASRIVTTLVEECSSPWEKHPSGCVGPISDLRIDSAGNLLFSEFAHNRLRSLDVHSGAIAPVAGNGDLRSSGDGGRATEAGVTVPHCFTLASNGDIVICDSSHRIRRINAANGIIRTVAGSGRRSLGGDHGPAFDAEFSTPVSVAVDRSDNLYIADDTSNRIRRVDVATGTIETVAGSGPPVSGSFVTVEFSGEGGPATKARFTSPRSLTVDSDGSLLFVVPGRVCRVDNQGYIRTVAGVGKDGFRGDGGPATRAEIAPVAIALDERGNLFIAEYENNRIRRVDARSGVISTVVGNGLPHRLPEPVM